MGKNNPSFEVCLHDYVKRCFMFETLLGENEIFAEKYFPLKEEDKEKSAIFYNTLNSKYFAGNIGIYGEYLPIYYVAFTDGELDVLMSNFGRDQRGKECYILQENHLKVLCHLINQTLSGEESLLTQFKEGLSYKMKILFEKNYELNKLFDINDDKHNGWAEIYNLEPYVKEAILLDYLNSSKDYSPSIEELVNNGY